MKISFVIPVYNSEKYLNQCVASILNNRSKDIEVILVDDGSKDRSGKICDELAETDSRIKVIHQENKGICCARNAGLLEASGEWISFVDNDDIIEENAVDFILDDLDEEFDIIYYGFDEFRNENNIVNEKRNVKRETIIYEGDDIKKLQWDCMCRYKDNKPLMDLRLLTTPWGKIYRRNFLESNNLKFVDGMRREEDVSFNMMCLACCSKNKYVDYKMYHYRQFVFSESHSYKKNIVYEAEQALSIYKEIIKQYYEGRKDIQELYEFRVLWELLYCVVLDSAHINNPKKYKERKKDFNNLFNNKDFYKAITECDINRLGTIHRILGKSIKYKQFFVVCVLTRLQEIFNKIKYH